MTEREDLEADLAHSAFDDPQQTVAVIWYPDNDQNRGIPFNAPFDDSLDAGPNQVDGDGSVLESHHGKRIRSTGFLEVPKTILFNNSTIRPITKPGDSFWINDELWFYRRREGKDSARTTLRVVTVEGDFTQASRLRRH